MTEDLVGPWPEVPEITRLVQAKGGCGKVTLDRKHVCIMDLGHTGPHGGGEGDYGDAPGTFGAAEPNPNPKPSQVVPPEEER